MFAAAQAGQEVQSGLEYRQATACGVSTGAPASMDQASRMNWACVQASGDAEKVGSPGWKAGPVPAGGR
jgi:hypothetical protein